MTFKEYRAQLTQCLLNAGLKKANIFYSQDTIPQEFPAAIVALQSQKGSLPTSSIYLQISHQVAVHLVINIEGEQDPDLLVLQQVEQFRQEYRELLNSDIDQIEFYNARADSGRRVRIAKMVVSDEN